MGSLSNYLETKLMDHSFKGAAYTPATHLYIALHTADPTEAGSGAEVTNANNYARVQHDGWNAASARAASNNGAITYGQASGSWGTVGYWSIWDSGSWGAGNMLAYGGFTTPKSIISGNIPTIASGDVVITATTGAMSTYLANKLLDHFLLTATFTQPTNIAVALYTTNPADDNSGSEVANAYNYARKVNNTWAAAGATTGLVTNSSAITMNTASGSWGTVAYTGLLDSATYGGGNLLWYGAVTPSQAVGANDYMEWAIGDFSVTLD